MHYMDRRALRKPFRRNWGGAAFLSSGARAEGAGHDLSPVGKLSFTIQNGLNHKRNSPRIKPDSSGRRAGGIDSRPGP